MNGALPLPITSPYSRFSSTISMGCGGFGLAGAGAAATPCRADEPHAVTAEHAAATTAANRFSGSAGGQKLAGVGGVGRMTKLRHGPDLDLPDALTGEVEVLAHLVERARLAAVEPEPQAQHVA